MTRRGLLLFALLSILWGVPYLLIKVAVAEVSVPFLVFARAAVGALALLPFALTTRLKDQIKRSHAISICSYS